MKQFLILFVSALCLIALTSNPSMAQKNNDSYQVEKVDSTKYKGILGSQTHSGAECGHNRAQTGDRPSYRIIIFDLDLHKAPVQDVEAMSYQVNVRTEINAPYKKAHTFKFKANSKGKLNPNSYIDVPCYAESANFTVSVNYKDKNTKKIKPLKINGNSNQVNLSVDFSKEKIYAQNKTLGTFNKKLNAVGNNSKAAGLKIRVE